jgi:hypothetical protein
MTAPAVDELPPASDPGDPSAPRAGWWQSRPHWWPPAELLVAPALIVLLLHAITTREALFPNQGDLLLYFQKAEALANGGLPYRDFAFEYPPLALLSMAIPYLAWPGTMDFDVYRWTFTAWQMLLLVGTALVTARLADLLAREDRLDDGQRFTRTAGQRLVVLAIVTAPSLAFRFDLLPALLVAGAVLATLKGQAGWAGVLIALGGLVKVYPLVLAPLLAALWLARRDRIGVVSFSAAIGFTIAAVLLPVSLVAGDAAWNFLAYQADRGLQLETVAAGFILLSSVLQGAIVPFEFAFGAVHVAGPAADAYLGVQPALFVLGPLIVAAFGYVAARAELAAMGGVRAATVCALALAAVTMFIVTNKVISVQYVVWLLPLAALVAGGPFWLTVVIGLLSVAIHPLFYDALLREELPIIVVLCLRNVLLIGLLAWLLIDVVRRSPPALVTSDPASGLD